jgi:hypothetical protein
VPVDTLALAWRGENEGLQLPTSIAWLSPATGGAGRLVVADTRAGELRLFDAAGGEALNSGGPATPLSFPYLAGAEGDTAVVLVRGEDRLAWIEFGDGAGREVRTVPVPAGATAAVATPAAIWVKRADEHEAWLARLDLSGRPEARYGLPGPSWRYIGFLRARGDTLLSLSGYRPVVDLLSPGQASGAAPDTMALVGFDSPQMVRSHRFLLGEVDQPPLLTSSAAVAAGHLFALNLRGDHVRVDVYGPDGRLRRALVYFPPGAAGDHFPVDIAVRQEGAGMLLALVMQRPGGVLSEPGGYVLMLRWPGPTPAS